MSKIEMLTPENSAIALIDYQPAMYQGVQSHDRLVPFNNVQVLAKAAIQNPDRYFHGCRGQFLRPIHARSYRTLSQL